MNGELISRSKCKRQASQQTSTCLQTYIASLHTESSEQANQANQENLIKETGIQLNERKSTQQTGIAELLANEKKSHTLVFLPGLDFQLTFPSSAEVTQSAQNEPVITDTRQEYIHWLDELLAPVSPAQSAQLGELNTPTIGKLLLLMFLEGRWTYNANIPA